MRPGPARGRVDPSTPQRRGHRRGVPLRRLTAQSHPSMLGGDPRHCSLGNRPWLSGFEVDTIGGWTEMANLHEMIAWYHYPPFVGDVVARRWSGTRVEREQHHRAPHLAGSGPGGGKQDGSGRDARAHTPFSTIARPPSTSASPPTPRPHRSDRRDEHPRHCLPCMLLHPGRQYVVRGGVVDRMASDHRTRDH